MGDGKRTMTMTLALVALALVAGCTITIANWPTPAACPTCAPCAAEPTVTVTPTATRVTPTPVVQQVLWDARLDSINARVEPLAGRRYQLAAAWLTINGSWDSAPQWAWEWVDKATGGGGDHHMFAGVYNADGTPLEGKAVVFGWPDGSQGLVADAAGWCNTICQAVYYPDQGQTGPYYIQPLRGDKLVGGGLPYGQHYSVFGVWREVPPAQVPSLYDIVVNWFWAG